MRWRPPTERGCISLVGTAGQVRRSAPRSFSPETAGGGWRRSRRHGPPPVPRLRTGACTSSEVYAVQACWRSSRSHSTSASGGGAPSRGPLRANISRRRRSAARSTPSEGGSGASTPIRRRSKSSGSWRAVTPLPEARGGTGAAAVAGRVVSVGGEAPPGTISSVYAYVPASKRWQRLPDLPTPRHGLAVVALGSRVYVIGGGPRPGLFVSAANESLDPRG